LIRGPDELAEGLAVGAQSLLGHVVGGTAGSLSLIAASLGNTLSTLSFDDDYRKRRRFNLQSESDLPLCMLRAAQTFAMGVALGLSGLFTKPVTGKHL
jgi:vacuolar protein sorting-associated protein 13A/C